MSSKTATKAAPAAKRSEPAETAVYLVGAMPIRHDEDVYAPGDEIELTERQAARLGAKVTPRPTTTQPE